MRPSVILKVLVGAYAAAEFLSVQAQSVTVNINTGAAHKAISPLIYGYNAYADGSSRTGLSNQGGLANLQSLNPAARRLGGNNMTSYNWENGVSNSGADWCNSSNAGLSYSSGAGAPASNNGLAYYAPGAALSAFQNQSLQLNTFSLLQLPAAGKLPKDIVNLYPPGLCQGSALWQNAPGPSNTDLNRWLTIVNDKPVSAGALSTSPSLSDGVVYIDEEINFLMHQFGAASTAKGVKAYELDNEPDLWHVWPSANGSGTHPYLYPQLTTVTDVIQRNLALAKTVKRMDGSAQTFGPALSGYLGLFSLWSVWDGTQGHQPADWGKYNVEPYLSNHTGDRYRYNGMTMANAYLDQMRQASVSAGKRLLDVFSFHYYPQLSYQPSDRVQASRSLWDAGYVEGSWITQPGYGFTDGRGLQMLPKLNQSIADFYPGTKLAVTEYDFGGQGDISGAIAQADALGAFAANGVYFASYFGDLEGYVAAGFRIFRNYDGLKSTFPDTSVSATSSNNSLVTVYAGISAADPNTVHLIAINRAATAVTSTMQITHPVALNYIQAYGVDGSSSQISARAVSARLSKNSFSMKLPAMSVYHLVLKP